MRRVELTQIGEIPVDSTILSIKSFDNFYVLPSGSKAKAFDIIPMYPAIANGCNGNDEEATSGMRLPEPRNHSMKALPSVLARKR